MAGISVGAPQGHQVEAGSTAANKEARIDRIKQDKAQKSASVGAAPGGDTVTLSAAAKGSAVPAVTAPSALSDSDAQTQSVNLRQLLSSKSLSATATQNQAILSLLR